MTASSCCCVELHCGVLRRVKLYQLQDGERWRDAGTGLVRLLHCRCSCQHQPQTASTADELRVLQLCDAARSLLPASACSAALEWSSACGCPSLLVCVWSEETEETLLLVHRVAAEGAYCLQAETIISWSEAGGDWALSFQDRQRCDETLAAIADHQQEVSRTHSAHCTAGLQQQQQQQQQRQAADDDRDGSADSPAAPLLAQDDGDPLLSGAAVRQQAATADSSCSSSFLLPLPHRDNLEAVHLQLQSACSDSAARAALVGWLTAAGAGSGSGLDWLLCLQRLLCEREAAADERSLQLIFALTVGLLNLHDEGVLELQFSSAHCLLTLCCLEYDPAVCSHLTEGGSRPLPLPLRRHSQALQAARCHRVPALQSAAAEGEERAELQEMERALHFAYRLSYARDAALLPHLSDAASAAFTSLLFLCRLSVLQRALEQPQLLHSLAASMTSGAEEAPSCRCDRQRLAALPPPRPSRSSFRSGLQLLSELLSLCRNAQPQVRSAFTQLLMEHRLVAIIAARLREAEEDAADGVGSRPTAAAIRWSRWLVPAAVGVLSCLLSHCPDAFRAAYCLSVSAPAGAASRSVVQLLLSLLCRAELLDAASAGHISAFLRLLADAEAEPDAEDEDSGRPAAWLELERCLMQEEAQQQRLPAALIAFAGHAEPQRVRLAAVGLLDWLSFCTARLSASGSLLLPAFLLRHRLIATCTAFLQQQRVLAAGGSPAARLPVWLHSADVLLAVVRFLSAVLSLRLRSLLRAMMEAQSFRLLLCLLQSPRNRDNLLSAAVLELFSSLARAPQPQQQLRQEAEPGSGEGEEELVLLPVLEHVVSLLAGAAASCSPLVSAVLSELEQRLQRVRSWKRERLSSGRHPRHALQQRRRVRGDADGSLPGREGKKKRRVHRQRSERQQDSEGAADGEQGAQQHWPSLSLPLSPSSSLTQTSPSPASAAASPSALGFFSEYDDSDSGDEEEAAADDAAAQRRLDSPHGSSAGEGDGSEGERAEAEQDGRAAAASGLRARQERWNKEVTIGAHPLQQSRCPLPHSRLPPPCPLRLQSVWFDSIQAAAEGEGAGSDADVGDGASSSLFAPASVAGSLELGWERLQQQRRQQAEAEERRQQLDIRAAGRAAAPSSSSSPALPSSAARRPIAISLQLRARPAAPAVQPQQPLSPPPSSPSSAAARLLLSPPAAAAPRPHSPPVPEFSHIDELEGLHLRSSAPQPQQLVQGGG